MMVCGPLAGFLSDRIGSRFICTLGSAALIAAFMIFGIMGTKTTLPYIILALAIEGIGIGLVMPANFNRIMGMSSKGDEGVVNSLVSTVRNVGAVMGIAVFTLIFLSVIEAQGLSRADIAAHALPERAVTFGFHAVFLSGAALGGLLVVLNLATRDKKKAADQPGKYKQ